MHKKISTKKFIKYMSLCMILFISIFYEIPSSNFNQAKKVFATSKSASEAMSWVKSQVGHQVNGGECVGLITAYYSYLGVSPVGGNGRDYATNALPAGWSRVQGGSPQTGDILVYSASATNQWGHVAIYESAKSTYHQNYAGNRTVQHVTNVNYNGFDNPYWGYIRPNWSNTPIYHNPEGSVDVCQSNEIGKLRVAGWTYDPDSPSTQNEIHVYIGPNDNDHEGHNLGPANGYRQDVDNVHHCGAYHGFDKTISTNRTGNQRVRVYAINVGGGNNALLYDKTVFIKPDSEAPILEGCNITDLNDKGYTVTCTWSDNIGVTNVDFPTWDASTQYATWYQGTSAEAGKKSSTWKFTFSKAETGKKYFTHIYASDAAGNRTCFPLTRTTPTAMPIEPKNDTTAPVFENVALTQEEEGTVTLSVQLSDDTGLGKLSRRPGSRFLWYSADKNSSYLLDDYYTGITSNINCWSNNGKSVPIVEKKYTGEETTSVECDSIVGYGITAQDLSGNYAIGNHPLYSGDNIYHVYQIRSGNIKGQKNKSIEITLNQGEEITLGAIREKLSQFNNLDLFEAYFDAKNERILKKSNCPDNNMISDREEEKKVILTANEPGTEYVYFMRWPTTAQLYSCKITVMSASCKLGDVYQDGNIDGKDVSLLLQCRLKKRELTEEQIAAGDVYADGKIDGKDVSKLLQYRLGKISSLE